MDLSGIGPAPGVRPGHAGERGRQTLKRPGSQFRSRKSKKRYTVLLYRDTENREQREDCHAGNPADPGDEDRRDAVPQIGFPDPAHDMEEIHDKEQDQAEHGIDNQDGELPGKIVRDGDNGNDKDDGYQDG